jgi:NADPH:quinone reductase-like Zn-dependent oxidoreductase
VNHLDVDIRAGTSRYPIAFPHQLGREAAGVVVAVGDGVARWKEGDRVLVGSAPSCRSCSACLTGATALCERPRRPGIDAPGGYAELASAPEHGLFAIPDGVSFEQAACVQLAFGTTWHALIDRGQLRAGETALVLAAASGTGTAAVQIARLAGAHVIAAVGSEAKAERVRALGVDAVVVYGEAGDLAAAVEAHAGPRGVDVVLDGVGGPLFREALRVLRRGGRLVSFGAHGGETVPFDLIEFFRSYTSIVATRGSLASEIESILAELETGVLTAVVDGTYPLEDAWQAHERLERREVVGRVLLVPNAR